MTTTNGYIKIQNDETNELTAFTLFIASSSTGRFWRVITLLH